MFKKIALISSVSMALTNFAYADYQWELSGNYTTGDVEAEAGKADQDLFNFRAKYLFNKVDTSKGPLAEAEFLNHASFVEFGYQDGEFDIDDIGKFDTESYGINGRWVHQDTGWLAKASYRVDKIEDEELDSYSVGFGKYLGQETMLSLAYQHAEVDDRAQYEADFWGIDFEHMFKFSNGTAFKVSTGYDYVDFEEGDSGDQYEVAGTYYLNDKLGFGASYQLLDADDEWDSWKVHADWYFTDNAAVTLSYGESSLDNVEYDSEQMVLGIRARF